MKLKDLIPDFSAVPKLLKFLSGGITSIPKVFGKNFFKERYYLHFFLTILLTLLPLRIMFLYMYLGDTPLWFHITCGWVIGYVGNIIREGYLEDRGRAKFDWCDVHAGGYAGIVSAILYNAL